METAELFEKSVGENLVVKANALIEARYSLSLSAQRVFATAISSIDSRKKIEEEQYVPLTLKAVKDLFGEVTSNTYHTLKQGLDDLVKSNVTIMTGSKKGIVTNWIQSYKFDDDEQALQVLFTREVIPYISQLNSNFTKYKLKNIVKLTSVYAVRLFEYCCMWLGKGQNLHEFRLDEFREMLGVPKNKYKQFGQLKDRVIAVAIDQVNIHTDFFIEVAFRKAGRSFSHIQLRLEHIPDRSDNIRVRKVQNKQQKALRIKRELEQVEQELLEDAIKAFEYLENGTRFLDEKGVEWIKENGNYLKMVKENRYASNLNSFIRRWYIDEKIKIIG